MWGSAKWDSVGVSKNPFVRYKLSLYSSDVKILIALSYLPKTVSNTFNIKQCLKLLASVGITTLVYIMFDYQIKNKTMPKTIGIRRHKHTCLHNGLVRTPAVQYLLKN